MTWSGAPWTRGIRCQHPWPVISAGKTYGPTRGSAYGSWSQTVLELLRPSCL
ncbi:hypothetical protein ACFFX0_09215 [Citricoccus parietis]|uniref:Uncharacterized protein n=1 Tax=Citricoccus parietis TaxID=592307 RepID=A0ABV5FXH0_9MICC